jgi:hypothetical protein
VALNFTNNTAGGDGGAVFRGFESCGGLSSSCFLSGVGQGVVFASNRAGKAGGAVHVACSHVGAACAGLFAPPLGTAVPVFVASVMFRGNAATLYGNAMSTEASTLEWARESQNSTSLLQSVAPGLQTLSLAVELHDDLNSVVRGKGESVSFVVCSSGGTCSEDSGVLPATVQALDPATGGSRVVLGVECVLGSTQAVVRVAVLGAASPDLERTITVKCRCNAGQARQEVVGRGTWVCRQCAPGDVVVCPRPEARSATRNPTPEARDPEH